MRGRTWVFVVCSVAVCVLVLGGLALAAPPGDTPPATLSKGGQLYDKWWQAAGVAAPTGDQALWSTQTINTRKGLDTWRCKECHGWDYKGKDGVYGSGGHKTGFVGVAGASKSRTQEQIASILKGSANPKHNFTPMLDDAAINALAAFVKDGVLDLSAYIDEAAKKPKGADPAHGRQLYTTTCEGCHGANGATINFGSDTKPEYVGTVAGNPQEFVHKVRFGQPGTPMPSGAQLGWTMKDVVDVLAHAQTLPTKLETAAPAAKPQAAVPAPSQLPKSGEPTIPVNQAVAIGLIALVIGWAGVRLSRRGAPTTRR